jgi:glycerophosphoryl diester phosphodiesterase
MRTFLRRPIASRTQLVCHRGANQIAPENTYAASEAAISLGAAYVEIDVRMSSDGVAYILHDATVDRTTDGSGPIAEMTSEALDALDAGSWFSADFAGQRLPKLNDWLGWLKGKSNAYVEIKQAPVSLVRDMVLEHGWGRDDTYFLSENKQIRADLLRLMPEFRHMVPVRWAGTSLEQIADEGYAIVEFLLDEMTPENMQRARDLGLAVQIFHPDDDAAAFRRIHRGRCGIRQRRSFADLSAGLRADASGVARAGVNLKSSSLLPTVLGGGSACQTRTSIREIKLFAKR